jgi:hypothetical protein
MAGAPGQNATVEEILASIRQAISEDDARRTVERGRGSAQRPVIRVSEVFQTANDEAAEDEADVMAGTEDVGAAETAASEEIEATGEGGPEHEFIEHAIEQAIDGVRAELEGGRSSVARSGEATRAIPRANRFTVRRREASSSRPALMSPRTDTEVSASFERLTKAMVKGDAEGLDAAVEDVLRPMLKQWLDSNLPQMVERLVREEIERVARGRR